MNILTYPQHERALRQPALELTVDEIKTIDGSQHIEELKALACKDGVAVAATQVGWPIRLFVSRIAESPLEPSGIKEIDPVVYYNPKILGGTHSSKVQEGCLSFPDLWLRIDRNNVCRWQFQDRYGEVHERTNLGFFARMVQHEVDHINGVLMIDKVSAVQRLKVDAWLKKQK